MRIVVINLDAAKDRLAFQERQMASLGLAFTRMRAVSTDDLGEDDFQRLAFGWERPLRRAELACFLSHKSVWKFVQDLQQPVLVLEDDAYISSTLLEILPALENLSGVDYLTLEARGRKKLVARHENRVLPGGVIIRRLYQDRTGAAGYVLWPEAAAKLVSNWQSGVALADAYLAAATDLKAYQSEPALVMQLDRCDYYHLRPPVVVSSSIATSDTPREPARSLMERLKFRYRRVRGQLRMGLRRLSVLWVAERRNIAIARGGFMGNADAA